jgi:GTPase SAR1 family protein
MAAGIVVFDVNDRHSFERLEYWVKLLIDGLEGTGGRPIVVVVGNKVDRADHRVVSASEVEDFLKNNNIEAQYFETSAADGAGVDAIFESIADSLCAEADDIRGPPPAPPVPNGAGQKRWAFTDKITFNEPLEAHAVV